MVCIGGNNDIASRSYLNGLRLNRRLVNHLVGVNIFHILDKDTALFIIDTNSAMTVDDIGSNNFDIRRWSRG